MIPLLSAEIVLVAGILPSCGDGAVPVGRAAPPPLAEPGVVRLLALGDAGKGNEGQRRVAVGAARACAARGCDLAVLLGDNLYPRGMESSDDPRISERTVEMYADLGVPLYLVLGNHDYAHGR